MRKLDIIVPVNNEEKNIFELVVRIDRTMIKARIPYRVLFIDDRSTDETVKIIKQAGKIYPVRVFTKKGKKGKAYSILEGARRSHSKYLAMLDGDLQYPPEALTEMIKQINDPKIGVVVANRKKQQISRVRRFVSRAYDLFFNKILLGLDSDVQSGLKIFRRSIVRRIRTKDVRPWTFDMVLLKTAVDLGFSISCTEIDFAPRTYGQSNILLLKDSWQIGSSALRLKLSDRKVYRLRTGQKNDPLGAGIIYNKRHFITHTLLPHRQSAIKTLAHWQKFAIVSIGLLLTAGFIINLKATAIVLVAILSFIYFLDLVFSTVVLLKSLHFPPEIKATKAELAGISSKELPRYTILCPLYKEAAILPHFVRALRRLDWPKKKLEVLLLLEKDDPETLKVAKKLHLPRYIKTVIVPASEPKTKPKACNYGLARARGEFVVVYDAEDRPDPLQLKKAYLAFRKRGPEVYCLQSKLNYYNQKQNLLTRLFSAEYSLWFDLILPGLQSIEAIIPLGGTSNHFRTQSLRDLHAWDPFNVTEDCDLGVRLFKAGYRTALIDSTTFEEANSNIRSWLRQRSRWIKGYLQTYLVHMRDPIRFVKEHGGQAFVFQLVIGMRMVFILINPIFWAATISYFTAYRFVGPAIEALYPPPVFYIALTSLVLGNFIYLYNYMIGCAKRRYWGVIKYIFLVPFYWLITSMAAAMAFYQLVTKPYYWEKTKHGLFLPKSQKKRLALKLGFIFSPGLSFNPKRLSAFWGTKTYRALLLVAAAMIANVLNFVNSTYLGRTLLPEEFGLLSLMTSLLFIAQIPSSALGQTISHQTAFLYGKHGRSIGLIWTKYQKKITRISLILTVLWTFSIPFQTRFFHSQTLIPFIVFIPMWFILPSSAINGGFLGGNLRFGFIATLVAIEALAKLAFSVLFVTLGLSSWVYTALPLSLIISLASGWFFAKKVATAPTSSNISTADSEITIRFPKKFFTNSILTSLSSISFLSLDLVMVKHFFSATQAGEYAILALSGRIVFIVGSLFTQFILPFISKDEGAGNRSKKAVARLSFVIVFSTLVAFTAIGPAGKLVVPLLFGNRAAPILPYLPAFAAAITLFTLANSLITYHQAKKHYLFAVPGIMTILLQGFGLYLFHLNLDQVVRVIFASSTFFITFSMVLHIFYHRLKILISNLNDFAGLFFLKTNGKKDTAQTARRILIFNWRDTKHIWAGGAEIYIHELARRWVKIGCIVTLFCGNDGHCPRNEVVDGVHIIRRGGFYMVYVWAFLYYLVKFRKHADVIIDSENGIPFFTPLYAKQPVIGLIHHIHSEIILKELRLPKYLWPVGLIAKLLESKIMPFVYRNCQMVTVSKSTKKDMERLGFGLENPIKIVNPGVDLVHLRPGTKTKHPTILYLGRLKPYKSIDTLVKAVSRLIPQIPRLELKIAGFGESRESLEKLTRKLGIEERVSFLGRVSELEKGRLLRSSWAFVYPSSMEGWGIAAIEASASGTAVIASDVPGLRDSVNNPSTGFLIEYGNVKAFADCIKKIITDDVLRKKLEKRGAINAHKYAWQTKAEEFMETIVTTISSESATGSTIKTSI